MTPDAFAPMASSYSPFSPLDGVGGGGMFGGLGTQLMLQSFMGMAGGMGYAPMGVNDRNLFDRMNHLDMTMQHRAAVQAAAGNDRPMFDQIGRGMANLMGYRYGPAAQQMADTMHRGYQMAAPAIMEMPGAVNFLDSLSPTGNQAAMTHGVFKAGRRMTDPFSGRFGLSGEGSAAMANSLFNELYAGDRYSSMPLKAGAFGAMMDEMQTRGMGPTLLASGAPSARLQSIFSSAGVQVNDLSQINTGDRDKLSQLFKSDPSAAAAAYGEMSRFDSKKSASRLKDWAGAVEAMREIFGDAGNPNAPMSQLIDGLNQLTSGGMTQLDPGRLQGIVRTTANLSKSTGIGMEGSAMMTQLGAAYAGQMGMSSVFAAFATQGSLGFMQAMQATGGNQHPVWGRSDAQRLMLANQRLTLGAFGSDSANRMGLAMRLGESLGFNKGSDASNYVDAVKNGQDSFMMGGKLRSTNMSEADYSAMMTGSAGGKLTSGMLSAMLQQRDANQEFLANNPEAAMSVRRAQGAEVFRRYGTAATGIIGGFLREKGVKDNKLAERLGGMFAGALANGQLTDEILSDPAKKKAFFQQQLGGELKKYGLDGDFAGMMGDAAFGEIDRELRSSGQGSLADVLKLFNPTMLAESDKARATAQAKGVIGGLTAPLGKGSMMSRFMTALIEGGPGSDLSKIALETVGAERGEKIKAMLSPDKIADLQKKYGQIDAATAAAANETDPAKRKALMGQAEKLASAFQLEMAKLNKNFVNNGLIGDDAASSDEVVDAADRASELAGKLGKGNRADMIKALQSYNRQASSLGERGGGKHEKEWAKLDAAHSELMKTIEFHDPEMAKQLKMEDLRREGADSPGGAADASKADSQITSIRLYINDKAFGEASAEFEHNSTDV